MTSRKELREDGLNPNAIYRMTVLVGYVTTPRSMETQRSVATQWSLTMQWSMGKQRSVATQGSVGKQWSMGMNIYIYIYGDAIVRNNSDYILFKNWWSSGRYFTWTRSNNMWCVGCFYGTGDELIAKAYQDSKLSGREYERVVNYVKSILEET